MNAVAAKPRTRAISATKTPRARLQPRLATSESIEAMRAGLREVDRLLTIAWDAANKESLTESLLELVNESLLPEALQMLCTGALTRNQATQGQRFLLRPMDLMLVAAKITDQPEVKAGLMEACRLLDETQANSLHLPGWIDSLPVGEPTWAELTRPIVARIADLIQHAGLMEGTAANEAFRMLDDADCALHFMATAPLADSLWNQEAPSNAIAVLECARSLMIQAQRQHAQHGGLNTMQSALLPGLLNVLDQLTDALLDAPGVMEPLHAIPQSLEAAMAAPKQAGQTEPPAPVGSAKPEPTTGNAAFHDLAVDALSLAQTKVQQAARVLHEYGDSGEITSAFGLIGIVEPLDSKLDELIASSDMGTPSGGPLCDASLLFLYAHEITRIVSAHENDTMLQAVASLLQMAKDIVDDANEDGYMLRREATNG